MRTFVAAVILAMVGSGCSEPVCEASAASPASAPEPVARPATLYLRLLEGFLACEDLLSAGGPEGPYLSEFRFIGSFKRMPEGTTLHVSIGQVDIPAACVMHGRQSLVFQDGDGQVVYRTEPPDTAVDFNNPCEDLYIRDGCLYSEGKCLLHVEMPGLIDLLAKKGIPLESWNDIDFEHMTFDWENYK